MCIYILNLRVMYIYIHVCINTYNHPGVSIEYAIDSDAQKETKESNVEYMCLILWLVNLPPPNVSPSEIRVSFSAKY